MAASKRRTTWHTFGWHGISLQVPKDWELGKVTGNAKSGYARLDDGEIVRVEIEWRTSGASYPVSQIVGKYLTKLEKEAHQKGTLFNVQRHLDFIQNKQALKGHEYECFRWVADYRAHSLARRCRDCGRLVLVRVFTKPNERMEDLVSAVLASMNDHPEEGKNIWAVYDLMCTVPEALQLLESSLKSGNIQLTFHNPARRKPEHTLQVEYVGLASMLLREVSLIEWFESFFAKSLRDFRISHKDVGIRGHPGVEVLGRPKPGWRQLLAPMPFISRRPKRYMKARAWHCEDSNKIFAAKVISKDESDELFEVMPIEVVCHQAEDASEPRGHAELPTGSQ